MHVVFIHETIEKCLYKNITNAIKHIHVCILVIIDKIFDILDK